MNVILGQFLALLTAGCWAQNSVVYGLAGKRVGSGAVAHIRLWIALPIMLLVHRMALGSFIPHGITTAAFMYLSISGFAGFFLADILLFQAYIDIGHRKTLVLLTISPIFTAAFSWGLFNEILNAKQIAGILVTLTGIGIVVFLENPEDTANAKTEKRGVIFAILAALAQAIGMLAAKYGLDASVPPLSVNLIRITAGFIGLVLFSLLRGQFTNDFRKMRDVKALLLLGSGAIVGPVIGIALTMYALTYAPVGIVTTIVQTSPILLLPVDWLLFKRKIVPGAIVGTIVAVAGAVLLFV